MYSCNLCDRGLLDRSVPFGYKIALPQFHINKILKDEKKNEIEESCCKYFEVGLAKRPKYEEDGSDVVVKLSDSFGHCPVRRGNEVTLEIKQWVEIMDHQEYIERYFANVPVIQRYTLSDTLVMYFETFDDKKCVCLTRESEDESANIVLISEETMSFLFSLSEFVNELYDRYRLKVPYTFYVFEKFLQIVRSSAVPDVLERTKDHQERQELVRKCIRTHRFFDETCATQNELIELCSSEISDIILKDRKKC